MLLMLIVSTLTSSICLPFVFKLAQLYIELSEGEECAIPCHDGLYDFMKDEMRGKETPLLMVLHWADMWSSRVVEHGSDKEEAEE